MRVRGVSARARRLLMRARRTQASPGTSSELWVPGVLPDLNKALAAARSARGRYSGYARLKKDATDWVALHARALPAFRRVRMEFTWHEPNRRTDPDNLISAKKFILDGLVQAGVLPGDGWENIASFGEERWFVVARDPGVLVFLAEVEN